MANCNPLRYFYINVVSLTTTTGAFYFFWPNSLQIWYPWNINVGSLQVILSPVYYTCFYISVNTLALFSLIIFWWYIKQLPTLVAERSRGRTRHIFTWCTSLYFSFFNADSHIWFDFYFTLSWLWRLPVIISQINWVCPPCYLLCWYVYEQR